MESVPQVQQVADFLSQYAPSSLAAEWDNVGLLVGDGVESAPRIMTCLTITPDSAAEAIDEGASLIVSHHPLPFRPLKQLTTHTPAGTLLWRLIRAGVSIYSPHTAFDSAAKGINQLWAERLGLVDVVPLEAAQLGPPELGVGRVGRLPEATPLDQFAQQVSQSLALSGVQFVGNGNASISRVAIACGSGGSLLGLAEKARADLLLTGEASFHTCLEAEALGIAMVLTGHFASERFGVEHLATVLQEQFPAARVWASQRERDPLQWVS
jgi:dinuclear metal center YbgI/SA1388 family protein